MGLSVKDKRSEKPYKPETWADLRVGAEDVDKQLECVQWAIMHFTVHPPVSVSMNELPLC